MTAPQDERKQLDIDIIDYLRGVAAFGVVLFHNRIHLYVGVQAIYQNPEAFTGFERAVGAVAVPTSFFGTFVMLFFVISGFCIHVPYAGSPNPLKIRHHLVRRFVRVYIPYATVVVATLVLEHWSMALSDVEGSSTNKFVETFLMVQNHGTPPGQLTGNASLWSLPIEMELYLIFPLIHFVLVRFGTGTAAAAVVIATAVGVVGDADGWWWTQGSFLRYWAVWWLGAVLAELYRRPGGLPTISRTGAVTALLTGALIPVGTVLQWAPRYLDLLSGTFFFLVVWWVLRSSPFVARIPARLRTVLKAVGLSSYSLYLIHFPLFFFFGAIQTTFFSGKSSNYLVPLALSFGILPVAYLFYLAIEKPSHALARKLAARFD